MQVNGDEPTIERDLFRAFVAAGAISKANADDPKKSTLVRCARTDKGVHAAGNVISLKLIIEDEDVVEKINNALPEQIRIWGIQRTMNSFSCYQMCDSRWYEYLMPAYSLLPPHPDTYLGKKIAELAKEYNGEEELAQRMEDVKDFWSDVEEKEVKPILDKLEPQVRAEVLERLHAGEDIKENEVEKPVKDDQKTAIAETSEDAKETTEEAAADSKPKTKKRQPTAVDFALRDIKAAYVAAKRRYRVSEYRLKRLQEALSLYEGSHIFHNYTVQKSPTDPSARRHIKSFVVNPEPIVINNTQWLSLKVHGQSFMMHQIRKMVGLAALLVRCGSSLDRIPQSYTKIKMAIPKAPGLGLLLERPVFEMYNRKADGHGKSPIDFAEHEEKMQAFKDKHIYQRIFEVEEEENL
jgi:tRNA pseudouridine38-40 synthase